MKGSEKKVLVIVPRLAEKKPRWYPSGTRQARTERVPRTGERPKLEQTSVWSYEVRFICLVSFLSFPVDRFLTLRLFFSLHFLGKFLLA